MKKSILYFLTLILFASCQKEIIEPLPLPTTPDSVIVIKPDTVIAPVDSVITPVDTVAPIPIRYYRDTVSGIILAGQSNAAGRIVFTNLNAPRLTVLNGDTTRIMAIKTRAATIWEPLNIAYNSSDIGNKTGMQSFIGMNWLKQYSEDLYIFQNAVGGMPISFFIRPGNEGYSYFENQLPAMIEKFKTDSIYFDIKGIIWYQGETDALVKLDSALYSKQLDSVRNSVYRVTKQKAPFIVVQTSDCQYRVKDLIKLQNTQKAWVAKTPGAYLIPKSEIYNVCLSDNTHPDLPTLKYQANAITDLIFSLN